MASSSNAYPRLQGPFAAYGEYHANFINQVIHITCVPIILLTAMTLGALYVDLRAWGVPGAALAGVPPTLATFAAASYAAFYIYLAPGALGVGAALMVITIAGMAHELASAYGSAVVLPSLLVHAIAWVAQFYGHGVHEKRAPALLDNLWQAFAMAPLFIFTEACMFLGCFRAFKRSVQPEISRRIKTFRAAARMSAGTAKAA